MTELQTIYASIAALSFTIILMLFYFMAKISKIGAKAEKNKRMIDCYEIDIKAHDRRIWNIIEEVRDLQSNNKDKSFLDNFIDELRHREIIFEETTQVWGRLEPYYIEIISNLLEEEKEKYCIDKTLSDDSKDKV